MEVSSGDEGQDAGADHDDVEREDLYSVGVLPVLDLKHLAKYLGSLNPQE